MNLFKELGLNDDLLKGIVELGFEKPTPVQELVIPTALTSTGDIVALAQTGTGKTAAFGLPLLQLIDPAVRGVQGLVLCPTRELCIQVANDIANFSKYAHQYKVTPVYGGASIDTQIRQLRSGTQIIVATPGRLIDLLDRGAVRLDSMKRLVLDEADEMLNMGFKDALDVILESCTNKQSTWLFSATMSNEVRSIAKNYMTDPLEITSGKRNQSNENIEHVYYVCRPDDRYATLKRIVDSNPGIYGLIFCRTKNDTKEIAEQMTRDGYNSDALHGDLSQSDRDRVMSRFREGTLQLLIATDVAARGIDVSDISHVINFGLPDDIEVYTHRSGRTGRAGKKGISITITTTKFLDRIPQIERMTKATFKKLNIPNGVEVCERQLMHIVKNIHDQEVQHDEIEPFLPAILEELQDLTKEELIKRFASVEFNRFLAYYKGAPDLNMSIRPKFGATSGSSSYSSGGGGGTRNGMQRLFVNIGEMDGIYKRDLVQLLTQKLNIPTTALGQMDIKKAYTHFDVTPEFVEAIKTGLRRMSVNNRSIRVDNASDRRAEGGEVKEWKKDRPRTDDRRPDDRRFDDRKKDKKYKVY
jgi:ATP-dependent RNA helicase DeaD